LDVNDGLAQQRRNTFGARAFEGSLDKLSIVDVLQLLHISQRTGRLTLESGPKRARLWLKNGHIVSGEHPDDKVVTGQIVIAEGYASRDDVEAGLAEQKRQGSERRPLIATLVQTGKLQEAQGFQVLSKLVEQTILEVLRWTDGTFLFEVAEVNTSDSFHHLPTGVSAAVDLDTQRILMDAVRILDEQNRTDAPAPAGGTDFNLDDFAVAEPPPDAPVSPSPAAPNPTPPTQPESTLVVAVPAIPAAPRPGEDLDMKGQTEIVDVAQVLASLPPQLAAAALSTPTPKQTKPAAARKAMSPRWPVLVAVASLVVLAILFGVALTRRPAADPRIGKATEAPTAVVPTPAPLAPAQQEALAPEPTPTQTPAQEERDSDEVTRADPDAQTAEGEPKQKAGKAKRGKVKIKAKDARSLFDTAIAP